MVTVWWNDQGVIPYSLQQPGKTVTAIPYCRDNNILREKLIKKKTSTAQSARRNITA